MSEPVFFMYFLMVCRYDDRRDVVRDIYGCVVAPKVDENRGVNGDDQVMGKWRNSGYEVAVWGQF